MTLNNEPPSGVKPGRGEWLLETERLVLVPPSEEMRAAVSDFVSRNADHFSASSPALPEEAQSGDEGQRSRFWKERMRSQATEMQAGKSVRLLLMEKDGSGDVIGECSFTNIVRGPFDACHLGYRLDRRVVGRGLMSEALNAAIAYVFESITLHRIMANYRPTNERSGRLLRRLGFVVEGYARDYLYLQGEWRDHVLTSLTRQTASGPCPPRKP